MKKFILFIFLLLPVSLFLSGCGGADKQAESDTTTDRVTVYTTVYPLYYFTERIGGEFVNVETIYPPGADEHTFEPSQKDMMKLADSDLFVYVGLGLEGFVEKAKETLKNENVKLLAAGENIHFDDHEEGHDNEGEESHEEEGHDHEGEENHEEEGHDHEGEENHEEEGHDHEGEENHEEEGHEEHNHGDVDPHVWIDPVYSKDLAEAIKNELIVLLPEHKEQMEENFNNLATELDDLNKEFDEVIHHAKHKEFIVSHSAYGYWEHRYGLEQISVSGISTSQEPSQKQLEKIISTAKEHDLKYIFFEQNVSSKLAEIVQKELNAKTLTLHNLSVLTDEDLKSEKNYFSIMKDNLKALDTALNDK
ncbi:zinc ABC transporter substrate-binding protein [Bacillus sp. 31A1R]|uniref:Zinc ABC transporter substrate-binding protein n=1 Tax=Robertmurraya mangrovi TaxID=3098077 RepID=A0ABU5IZN4_9BACI|nr:zinc ABC transporter substrate-binding protein [Bacillus sp. 31A1R]MDZ5472620.1 zinc ABC transporter substrate-binding protein [Bacillus sp. 31A1R]